MTDNGKSFFFFSADTASSGEVYSGAESDDIIVHVHFLPLTAAQMMGAASRPTQGQI